jgi:hypothetical protein
LEEVAVKGDEVLVDQTIASHHVVIEREAKQGAQFIVAVVGQTVSVRHQNEKDIEQAFGLAQATPEAMPDEAMLNKGKAPRDLTPTIRTEGLFFNHG